MLRQFSPVPVYLKIWRNRIEATHLETGETVSIPATEPFSSTRNVVGNFDAAQRTLNAALNALGLKRKFFPPPLRVFFQQREQTEGGLDDLEKRALRDLGDMAGAKEVYLIDHSNDLSTDEVLAYKNQAYR